MSDSDRKRLTRREVRWIIFLVVCETLLFIGIFFVPGGRG